MLYQRKHSLPAGGFRESQLMPKPKALSPSTTAVDIIFEEDSPNQQQQQKDTDQQVTGAEARKNGYNQTKNRNRAAVRKWTSAFRVVSAMTRLKNLPRRHQFHDFGIRSRGSSIGSDSNESTPTRTYSAQEQSNTIDPVYLALKQATTKYGSSTGSRRSSQNVGPNLDLSSQTSLQDSGTFSENELYRSTKGTGSTPQLIEIRVNHHSGSPNNNTNNLNGIGIVDTFVAAPATAIRPKLSNKMKSLSLDCADMPPPPQNGMRQQYKGKTPRSARAYVAGESLDQQRSASPSSRVLPMLARQRRLPPVPIQQQSSLANQQQLQLAKALPNHQQQLMQIVTHDYVSGDCSLHPGDRLVIMDNGDPDWKHGFKMNDHREKLLTFPSSCVAAYKMDEQPMRLTQSCNLAEQKLRLYRDQVVFVQPDSLSEDGRVLIRNEHDKFAKCPLQFLCLA